LSISRSAAIAAGTAITRPLEEGGGAGAATKLRGASFQWS